MKNSLSQEVIISSILIILLILLLNPFNFWMPNPLVMMLAAGLVIVFGIFVSFFLRERPRDEREDLHRMLAGRLGFLTGSGLLVLGIIVQTVRHNLDPWLVLALGGMILAKMAGLFYSRRKF